MSDHHIDQNETQIYGPHASRHIRRDVLPLLPAFATALEYVAAQVDVSTAAVGTALGRVRGAEASHRRGVQAKVPALDTGRGLLSRFSKHLDAHPAGVIDRKTFFPADGTVGGVGHAATDVLLALGGIAGHLGEAASPVKNAAEWKTEFDAAIASLAPAVEHASDARTDRSGMTPEVEAARAAWLTHYAAAKLVVEAVLRLTGKLGQMSAVFHDLAVLAGTKLTEAPVEPPAAPT
jgi:hypothetical protein